MEQKHSYTPLYYSYILILLYFEMYVHIKKKLIYFVREAKRSCFVRQSERGGETERERTEA